MLSLSIILTNRIDNSGIATEDIYNINLIKTNSDGVSRNITMPVLLDSEIGKFISNLSDQVWNYNPTAAPDSLSQAKAWSFQNIDSDWAILEKTGWDSGQGFHLGITPSDVALLVGVFSLAKEAAALGLPLPSLISMANTPITFSTIEEMTMLLLLYGQARSTMASEFAARRKIVQDATTVEELHVPPPM
jgi:hypothetical protein